MKYILSCIALVFLAACSTAPKDSATPVASGPNTPVAAFVVAKTPPRIGLALGGGAARGFAHVGVIQVLEEAGIRPQLVTGTSAGSLVAAIYASGKNGKQLQRVADTMEEATIADWTLPLFTRGMLRGDALARYVNEQVGSRLLEAVPAVFQPVRIAGRDYVDGGLVSPVPVRAARKMGAELVIAVDISSAPEGNLTSGTLDVLLQTFTIMGSSINSFELKDADIVVRPALVGVSSADFGARKRSIEAGRQAMLQLLPQLRAAITTKSR